MMFNAIVDTADHSGTPSSALSEKFMEYDLHNLIYGSLPQQIEDGEKILREYGRLDWTQIKMSRLGAMEKLKKHVLTKNKSSNIEAYINFLQGYTPKIAIFPGTFFEYTIGHDDILKRAEKVFDKVILCPGNNPSKQGNAERMEYANTTLQSILPNNQIEPFTGMLWRYVYSKPYPVTVVKGLRNSADFETNKLEELFTDEDAAQFGKEKLNSMYIISSSHLAHVSSSAIRMFDSIQASEGTLNSGRSSDRYRVK